MAAKKIIAIAGATGGQGGGLARAILADPAGGLWVGTANGLNRLEGEAFLPRYLRILSAGGSEMPLKILGEAGLDVTSPAFWQGGFDVLEKMVTELEQTS